MISKFNQLVEQGPGIQSRFKQRVEITQEGTRSPYDILLAASRDGKLHLLAELFIKFPECIKIINQSDKDGYTPLHYAVKFDHVNIVKKLIEYGAGKCSQHSKKNLDVDAKSHQGQTPLHLAARYRAVEYTKPIIVNPFRMQTIPDSSKKTGHLSKIMYQRNKKDAQLTMTDQQKNIPSYFEMSKYAYTADSIGKLETTNKIENFNSVANLLELENHQQDTAKNDDNQYKSCLEIDRDEIAKNQEEFYMRTNSVIFILLLSRANVNALDENSSTPLHYASMRGNSQAVAELLCHPHILVETKDNLWLTPLHHAAEKGAVLVANLLIENGANVNSLDKASMTPLHVAAEEGHYDMVKLMLEYMQKKDPQKCVEFCNSVNRDLETPLHFASAGGRDDIVKLLLSFGSSVNISTNDCQITPMHLACASGSLKTVKLLIEKNPLLLNQRDAFNEAPIHKAASLNKEDIVIFLIENNCEINCIDKDKETPFMSACKKDNFQIASYLLDKGADICAKDINDYNSLHWCAINDSVLCAGLLLGTGHSENLLVSMDVHENNPLHLAAAVGHYRICKMMLNSCKNDFVINSKNDQGNTPMMIAAKNGKITIVELFLEYSPSLVRDKDDFDNSALHLASIAGHHSIIELLLSYGAPVDEKNGEQKAPIECSIQHGWLKASKTLIAHDATIDPPDKAKISALLLASKLGHAEIVELLLESGCDIQRRDPNFRNCLDIAIDENHRDVVIALLNTSNWSTLLRNCSLTGSGDVTTPLRKLIRKMPEIAEVVFNKCITNNGIPEHHPRYELTLNYEFIDDIATPWGSFLPTSIYHADIKCDDPSKYRVLFEESEYSSDKSKPSFLTRLKDYLKTSFVKQKRAHHNKSHPLLLMVKKQRAILLSHPLISYHLRYKWRRFGRHLYYFRLLFFLLFLILITGYSFTVESVTKCIKDSNGICVGCPIPNDRIDTSRGFFFVRIGTILIFLMALTNAILKIFMFILDLKNISFSEIFELITCILVMIYVFGTFYVYGAAVKIFEQYRSFGGIALWMSYFSFALFMRKLPKVGIYMVMYADIFRTFLQFVPIYTIIVLSYGVAFYQEEPNAYVTPFRSIVKTLVATIGEIEYDTFYNEIGHEPLTVTWILLIAFISTNTLILMNLLVGLAVDDIQGVQSKAMLRRLALQVELAAGIEQMLPANVRKRNIKLEEKVYPNKQRKWTIWSLWEFKNIKNSNLNNNSEQYSVIKQNQTEMKTNIKTIKQRLRKLESQVSDVHRILLTIANNGSDIRSHISDMDDIL